MKNYDKIRIALLLSGIKDYTIKKYAALKYEGQYSEKLINSERYIYIDLYKVYVNTMHGVGYKAPLFVIDQECSIWTLYLRFKQVQHQTVYNNTKKKLVSRKNESLAGYSTFRKNILSLKKEIECFISKNASDTQNIAKLEFCANICFEKDIENKTKRLKYLQTKSFYSVNLVLKNEKLTEIETYCNFSTLANIRKIISKNTEYIKILNLANECKLNGKYQIIIYGLFREKVIDKFQRKSEKEDLFSIFYQNQEVELNKDDYVYILKYNGLKIEDNLDFSASVILGYYYKYNVIIYFKDAIIKGNINAKSVRGIVNNKDKIKKGSKYNATMVKNIYIYSVKENLND